MTRTARSKDDLTPRRSWRVFAWPAAAAAVAIIGLVLVAWLGDVQARDASTKAIGWVGTALFVVVALFAVRSAANRVLKMLTPMVGFSHAALTRTILTLVGIVLIGVAALGLLGVPVQQVLVGGAVTGIILGIAAQQSLANMFAGVVLLLAQPFAVGQEVTIVAGALGGSHHGIVKAVGFTYVVLDRDDGQRVRLPNAGVLAAAIVSGPHGGPESWG
jgi:small-conductance mechanosensitive channel